MINLYNEDQQSYKSSLEKQNEFLNPRYYKLPDYMYRTVSFNSFAKTEKIFTVIKRNIFLYTISII